MPELLTCAQMAQADHLSGIPPERLMARAGRAVAAEIIRRHPPCPAVVLCGPGNNGGDGFVVATALAQAGWPVRVGVLGPPGTGSAEAAKFGEAWRARAEAVTPDLVAGAGLVVDALFGAGLSRPLEADVTAILQAARAGGAVLVAIDVPSGVAGDSGADLRAAGADLTVTFFRKKPGHLLLPGRGLCGEVVVADIGFADTVLGTLGVAAWENGPALWQAALPRLAASGNKFSRGHALVLGGAVMTGAARMAARAAARAGAGLVSVAVPAQAWPVYAAALTSIMVRPLDQESDLVALLADTRITAMLVGPGAGVSEATRGHALALLETGRAVVLDADALSVFKGSAPRLFEAVHGPCVLTPHEGEFARVFPDLPGDKLARARAAARLSGAVIVLKGADTVVAAPDGRAVVNANAPAWLATAGSGDVLGGFILGLLAQGVEAFAAACAGVWLHGACGQAFGPGLMAEDLPDALPGVLRQGWGSAPKPRRAKHACA